METHELTKLINDTRIFLIREYAATPDTGEIVEADARPLFNRLCEAQAYLESVD